MRVLHVSHGWDEGGSALYADALVREQARQGASTHRFGPSEAPAFSARGFVGSFASPPVEAAFASRLSGIDIVHVHHLSGLSMALPAMAHAAGVPVVVTLHDYWLRCARGQLVTAGDERCPGPSLARCTACLAPHLWSPLPAGIARRLPPRVEPVRAREAAWASIAASTQLFLAPSEHAASRMGVPAEVLRIPLLRPVPPAPLAAEGPVRFLFLGSWLPTKGPDVVLAAFASLPSGAATLRMAGPTPMFRGSTRWAEALRARAEATPGVELGGAIPHAAIVAELHEADVLLVPSRWEETGSMIASEGLAAGLRVLASDLGGIPEVAPAATRVDPDSVAAWRSAMILEVRRGRGRMPCSPFASLEAHAGLLLHRYAALRVGAVSLAP